MATKQTIVAICLMLAVLLPEARSAIHKTPNTSRTRFAHHKEVEHVPEAKSGVDEEVLIPDAFLTTVREFHFYYDHERGNSGGRAPCISKLKKL